MNESARPGATAAPKFEIVQDRLPSRVPQGRARSGLFGVLAKSARTVVEDVYVRIARGLMRKAEDIDDALAGRRHAGRARRTSHQLPQVTTRTAPRHRTSPRRGSQA